MNTSFDSATQAFKPNLPAWLVPIKRHFEMAANNTPSFLKPFMSVDSRETAQGRKEWGVNDANGDFVSENHLRFLANFIKDKDKTSPISKYDPEAHLGGFVENGLKKIGEAKSKASLDQFVRTSFISDPEKIVPVEKTSTTPPVMFTGEPRYRPHMQEHARFLQS